MISARLVHLIESNQEQIVDRALAQVRRVPTLQTRSSLDHELRELGQDLLLNLGNWLSPANEQTLALRYERMGKLCFDQEIPLHEAVRGLTVLREKMLDFAQENLVSNSSVELYGEEELDRRLGYLFDLLIVHLVKGFEDAIAARSALQALTH